MNLVDELIFTGDHAYYYRCSLVHQAKLKYPSSDYESVYFTISENIKFDNCIQTIGNKKHYICDVEL